MTAEATATDLSMWDAFHAYSKDYQSQEQLGWLARRWYRKQWEALVHDAQVAGVEVPQELHDFVWRAFDSENWLHVGRLLFPNTRKK